MPTSSTDTKLRLGILLFVLAAGAAYGLTMREGLDWTEDYALYILHGVNMIEGMPYNHLGVADFWSGRVFSYPPAFPAVLAAVYGVFGLDFTAFKWAGTVFFLAFSALLIVYLGKHRVGSHLIAFLLAAAFIANPIVWELKDDVLSDSLFVLLCFACLFAYEELRAEPRPEGSRRVVYMAVVSLCLVAAYATRAVGIVLPLAILAFEVVRYRKIHLVTLAMLVPFAAYFVLQQFVEESFAGYMKDSVPREVAGVVNLGLWIAKLNGYRWAMASFFDTGAFPVFQNVLFYGLIGAPAALGFVVRVFRKLTVLEVFAVGYLALFILARAGLYDRYMLPLFVLLLLYAVEGLGFLSARLRLDPRYASAAVLGLVLCAYGIRYTTIDYGRLEQGITHASARALFEWIQRETGEDDVLVAQKGFSIKLMTRRGVGRFMRCTAPEHCQLRDRRAFWGYLKYIGASYIVLKKTDWPLARYYSDDVVRAVFVDPEQAYLSPVYENPDFTVVRIDRYPAAT